MDIRVKKTLQLSKSDLATRQENELTLMDSLALKKLDPKVLLP
jgi:hypothetical protein